MESDALPKINRVVLTGFLQQEPELRYTPGGVAVASFRLRIARLLPENRGGKETVSFVTVVAWQDLAQKVSREGKNGQALYVEGHLHTRSFETQKGERRTAVEVYAETLQLVPVHMPPGAEVAERPPRARSGERRGGQPSRARAPEAPRLPLDDGHASAPSESVPTDEEPS